MNKKMNLLQNLKDQSIIRNVSIKDLAIDVGYKINSMEKNGDGLWDGASLYTGRSGYGGYGHRVPPKIDERHLQRGDKL